MIARIALAVASLLVVLGLAEVGARLFGPPPMLLPNEAPGVLNPLDDIRKPDVEGLLVGIPFRTNSHGLRDREFSPRPAPGVRRIAITGDSVTMGWGVEEAQAYPKQVERMLGRWDAGHRYEVLNVGIAGAPIEEAIDRLVSADEAYAPGVLVYGFTANDIEGPHYRRLRSQAQWLKLFAERFRFHDSPVALLRVFWPRWIELRERLWPSMASYDSELRANYFDNPEAWSDFEAQLDRLAALAETHERCAEVFIHTDLVDRVGGVHSFQAIYDRVASAADARGLGVVRSLPAFEGERLSALRVASGDQHPNVHGQTLLAQALAQALEALPERCWETRSTAQAEGDGTSSSSIRLPKGSRP